MVYYIIYDTYRGGVDEFTLFDMASVTKPVVVTSLFLQAQSEGLLSWDDTLSMHFENVSEDKADIPLWRLLSHSSGFVARVSNSVLSTFENEEDRQAAVVDYILSTNLSYTPGTKVTYACNGYVVLGAILENVYGKSLDQLFLEKVAEPLGMENSGYKLFENATDLAKHQSNSNRVNDDIAHFINDVSGNAGLFSNILDMSVYAIAVAKENTELLDKMISYALKREREEGNITYSFDSNVLQGVNLGGGTKGAKGSKM